MEFTTWNLYIAKHSVAIENCSRTNTYFARDKPLAKITDESFWCLSFSCQHKNDTTSIQSNRKTLTVHTKPRSMLNLLLGFMNFLCIISWCVKGSIPLKNRGQRKCIFFYSLCVNFVAILLIFFFLMRW